MVSNSQLISCLRENKKTYFTNLLDTGSLTMTIRHYVTSFIFKSIGPMAAVVGVAIFECRPLIGSAAKTQRLVLVLLHRS